MNNNFLQSCKEVVELAREGRMTEAEMKASIVKNQLKNFYNHSVEQGPYQWMAGEVALAGKQPAKAIDHLRAAKRSLTAFTVRKESYADLLADVFIALARSNMMTKSYGEAASAYGEAIRYASEVDGEDSWSRVLALYPARSGAMFLSGDGDAKQALQEGLRRCRAAYGSSSEQTNQYLEKSRAMLRSVGQEEEASRYQAVSGDRQDEAEIVLDELDSLVGLHAAKDHLHKTASLAKVSKMRQEQGIAPVPVPMHLVFMGPPGTGKTSVAHIAARLYKALGLLPTSKVVSVTGGELTGGSSFRAAQTVNNCCDSASGGVLLVNEAYALARERGR